LLVVKVFLTRKLKSNANGRFDVTNILKIEVVHVNVKVVLLLMISILRTTTTTIFISCPEKFYNKNKYMQCEKISAMLDASKHPLTSPF